MLRQEIVLALFQGEEYTSADLGHNPTYLPDWLWDTCTPVMVIRHPALSVASFWQKISQTSHLAPGDQDFTFTTSLHYCRLLFDLLKSQGRTPIMVDGEDVVLRTEELTVNICNALGIDPTGAKEQWEPTPEDQLHPNPIVREFTKTIHESTGVIRSAKVRISYF